jgi:hypothetical protein
MTNLSLTPYIAVATNFYGTGNTAQESRKALVHAGGSAQEPQLVYKLPDGATNAYVGTDHQLYWSGTEGEAKPVFKYVNGKAVAWVAGEEQSKPVPFRNPPANVRPLGQNQGEAFPEPEIPADTVAPASDELTRVPEQFKAKRKPAAKPAPVIEETKSEAQPEGEKQAKRRPSRKPAPVIEEQAKPVVGSKVSWTSSAAGQTLTKQGEVTHVIPAGGVPPADLIRDPGTVRDHESYIVRAVTGGRARNYCPRVGALTVVTEEPKSLEQQLEGNPTAEANAASWPTIAECEQAVAPEGEEPDLMDSVEERSEQAHADAAAAPAVAPVLDPAPQPEAQPTAETTASDKPARKASKPQKPAAAKPATKPAADKPVTAGEASDFLMFVGSSFYSKADFIAEAAKLGISRRLPNHRLPKTLVCGASRIYLACSGARKTDGDVSAEVFGYFIPSEVHFIEGQSGEFADIVAHLKPRNDTKFIADVSGEPERECGKRQEGGTYLVVDAADSPLKLLDTPAKYEGNHFRGLLRLTDERTRAFNTGGTVNNLVDEVCMKCGGAMKCAPDGHARAERERARIAKGEPAKWFLLDAKCQAEVRKQRAADDGPQSAGESQDDGAEEATV